MWAQCEYKLMNKTDRIQIRVNKCDKDIIRKLKSIDPNFNVSWFLRDCLKRYSESFLNNGVGKFKIG